MNVRDVVFAFAAPYVVAWLVAVASGRVRWLPVVASGETLAQNAIGKLTAGQRRALIGYHLPELVFSLVAIGIALGWQPNAGLDGTVLRWGLGGMAFVRLGLLIPVWRDVFGGRAASLTGPLRKIAWKARRALATENGPIVVLPVDAALYEAHEAGIAATIFYAPHSRHVVAVVANDASAVPSTLGPAAAGV